MIELIIRQLDLVTFVFYVLSLKENRTQQNYVNRTRKVNKMLLECNSMLLGYKGFRLPM